MKNLIKRWNFKEKICQTCSNKFKPTNGKSITCSKECSKQRNILTSQEYRKRNLGYYAEKVRNWYKENPKKRSKMKDTEKAIVRDKTRKQHAKQGICKGCNSKGQTEFHHLSYEPNIFEELCRNCHLAIHSKVNRMVVQYA